MADTANLEVVSHTTPDGRVLSGVGVDPKALASVMERHAPKPEPVKAETSAPNAPVSEPPAQPAPVAEPPAEPPAPSTPEPPPEAAKKTRGQERFDVLTREREDARREAAELKQRLAALEARSVQQQPPVVQPPQLPPLPQFPPHLQTFDAFLAAFPSASYTDWTQAQMAHVVYDAQQSFDARLRSRFEADRASRSFDDQLQATWSKGREVFPDFEAVRTNGPGASIDLDPRATATGQPSTRIAALLAAPNSAVLQYAICKDADLATRLANCPDDVSFGLALAQVAPTRPVASPASTGTPAADIPAPYQPVGSGSKTTIPSSADLVKGHDFDASGYRERRAAERGVTRRS